MSHPKFLTRMIPHSVWLSFEDTVKSKVKPVMRKAFRDKFRKTPNDLEIYGNQLWLVFFRDCFWRWRVGFRHRIIFHEKIIFPNLYFCDGTIGYTFHISLAVPIKTRRSRGKLYEIYTPLENAKKSWCGDEIGSSAESFVRIGIIILWSELCFSRKHTWMSSSWSDKVDSKIRMCSNRDSETTSRVCPHSVLASAL